jgi:transcriptional regulator with AAA-type ATPase domain
VQVRARVIAAGVPRPPHDQTLTESPFGAEAPLARPEAYLVLVLECERPLAGSARHSLRGITEVAIGRGGERGAKREGERLGLTLPGALVSTAHARIRRDAGQWRLEDLGSRNGTRVNGETVVHGVLADGDVVEMGHALFLFREAMHAPPGTALDFDTKMATFPAPGLGTLIPALAGEVAALVRIAESPVPVLLRGETGSGKEVVARAVHTLSKRAGPFVPVNCGAIPDTLMESQLFGHTKGAFSGALRDEPGFVRAASGGTLFLDEIGDLPPSSQAALLRVLQEGEVVPVGTTRAVAVDLRVIAATHQPLEALVSRGTFRTDLLARLDGFTYALAPLRERREDIGLIVADLLPAVAPEAAARLKLAPDVGRALLRYAWPLNIRELRHCLARGAALAKDAEVITREHLPAAIAASLVGPAEAPAGDEPAAPDDDARLHAQLEKLLTEHDGNVAEVARAMGKARMQIHRWMKRLGIDPKRYRR